MRTTVGNIDGNAVGVHIDLLIDQVVRTALFLGKIGAQHILCILFGVFDLAGHLIAAQAQIQLFKRCNGGCLVLPRFKITRIDHISPAILQPQECYAVFLPILIILDKVDACIDLRGGIDLTVLTHPVDVDVVGLIFFRNNQSLFDILLAHAAVKGQQDIRRFVRIGVYRDLLRVSTAAGLRIRRICSQHDCKLLPVLQRDGLHHRLNALTAPVPFREFCDKRPLDAPALLVAEVGLEDLRNEHPHAHAEQGILRLSHRAEVGVDVIKRLLHTLADADVSDRDFRLAADDQLDVRAAEFCSGKGEALRDLYSAVYRAVGADTEIQMLPAGFHTRTAEGAQFEGGIQSEHVEFFARQIDRQFLRADEIDALVGCAFIVPFLSGKFEGVAEAVNELPVLAKSHNAHIACLERDLAGAEHHVGPALDKLQIGTRHCAPQLDGRNGEIVALYRSGQILEARAAAGEPAHRHRRDQEDARLTFDKEPQFIGDQRAVVGPLQRQLRLGLKEVKDVQLQFKGVALLTLEGVDLALDIGKLQRQHFFGAEFARGLYAVDLEFIPLQAVAQLFHRKLCAIENGLKADITAEHKVPRRVGSRLFQLYRSVGDVHIDDGGVVGRVNVKCKALFCEGDPQRTIRAVCRLIELESRRTQAHAALLHGSVLVDNELAAAAPRCRDGGREQRRPTGEGKGFSVFALIIAVDEGDGVSVPLFQRRKRRVVGHVFHRHAAAAGENGQPLGVDGGIDLVRFAGDVLFQYLQVAEAPEEVGGISRIILRLEIKAHIALAAHKGIQRFVPRLHTDELRQIDTERLAAGGGDRLSIVIRQANKGIGPGVAVHIRLGDVNAVHIAPRGIALGNSLCIQILHGQGDGGTFRGDLGGLPLRHLRHRGAAEFDGGAARFLQHGRMSHGGKAIEVIAPSKIKIRGKLLASSFDLNAADRRQHAPGVLLRRRPALLELHDLVVDRHLCGDMTVGREQVILRLDCLRASAVGRARHKFHLFQTYHHALGGRYALIIGSVIAVRRLAVPHTVLVRLCGGNHREIGIGLKQFMQRHVDVPVLQGQGAVRHLDLRHIACPVNVPRKGHSLRRQQAQQQTQRQ